MYLAGTASGGKKASYCRTYHGYVSKADFSLGGGIVIEEWTGRKVSVLNTTIKTSQNGLETVLM